MAKRKTAHKSRMLLPNQLGTLGRVWLGWFEHPRLEARG